MTIINFPIRKVPTEYQECKMYCDWLRLRPEIWKRVHHTPNEGKRSPVFGKMLGVIGLKAGYPDYTIDVPRGTYHGLRIEMKRVNGRNKKKNPYQQAWLDQLTSDGYKACYAYGCDEAIKITEEYMALGPFRL